MKNYQLANTHSEGVMKALSLFPEFQRKLLARRGITTQESADLFLNPSYDEHVHDPFLMKDMDKAVARILDAIAKKEKILIYSDYDHDGIPGGVILHDFFRKIRYTHFSNYIPHRHLEGYGLHGEAVEGFAKDEIKLLITVDCGISDVSQVARASELGIDVIITDHHIVPENPPKAFAILNSKQIDDTYPYDMLSGSGVAFKLVQGLVARGDFNLVSGWEKWLLDLVAIGTIADMVPLTGENRVLAQYGLQVLRKSPRIGLTKLFSKMKMNREHVSEDDIGFMLAPRINAASRMGEPMLAFNMLSTSDEVTANIVTDTLEKLNNERKGVVAGIVKEIRHLLEKRETIPPMIILGNPLWKPALLGLVCNSVMESFARPVFLWGREGGEKIKGSCRSNGSVDVVSLMASVDRSIVVEFGGHKMAGGFSTTHENVHLLESALLSGYEAIKSDGDATEVIILDDRMDLDHVTWQKYEMIERLAPFGIDNPKPLFVFERVSIRGVKQFGKDGNHLELLFENSSNRKVSAIGFFMNKDSFGPFPLEVGSKINLIASLEKSMFRNFPELRLRIVDVI